MPHSFWEIVGFQDQWDLYLEVEQIDCLLGPLMVISNVPEGWMALWQKLAFGWLADTEASVFAVQVHLQQNPVSEVVSEHRREPVVETLEHPNGHLEVSVD